jgi:hypothetical protein
MLMDIGPSNINQAKISVKCGLAYRTAVTCAGVNPRSDA